MEMKPRLIKKLKSVAEVITEKDFLEIQNPDFANKQQQQGQQEEITLLTVSVYPFSNEKGHSVVSKRSYACEEDTNVLSFIKEHVSMKSPFVDYEFIVNGKSCDWTELATKTISEMYDSNGLTIAAVRRNDR